MALRITPPAIQHVAAGLISNNKQTVSLAVKLVPRKRTDLSLSCEYRINFTRRVIFIPHRSLLKIVAACSQDGEGVKDKNLDNKETSEVKFHLSSKYNLSSCQTEVVTSIS